MTSILSYHRSGEWSQDGEGSLVHAPSILGEVGRQQVAWVYCRTGDAGVSISMVKLQHEKKVAELRGTISSDRAVVFPGWMLEHPKTQLGRGIGGIPAQG